MELVTDKLMKNTVTEGSKRTEVGVIPEDWEVKTLGECLKSKPSYGIGAAAVPYNTNLPRYLRITDISDEGRLIEEEKVSVDDSESNNYLLSHGDIVLARTGASVGKSYLYDLESEDLVYAGFLIKISIDPNKLYSYFLKFFLQTQVYWDWVKRNSMRSGQPGINSSEYSNLSIPLPPTLEEQQAIAESLSNVDALIAELDTLIEKKKQIKKGVMQQLLTGKKRLSNYKNETQYKQTILGEIPSDWKSVEFQDVLQGFSSGATPYRGRPAYYEGDIRWIRSSELNYGVINDTKEKITEEAVRQTNLKIHPPGTFLMAITGLEAEGTRGRCGIVGKEATTNQSCMALYPIEGEIISEYLFYFYQCYGDELAFKFCQGTKQQSYTAGVVKILPIHLPPTISEQKAIVEILSDMDAEIQALQSKRAKYEKIKQGMMQELLTGKTRLIIKEESHKADDQSKPSHNWEFDEAVLVSVLADRFGTKEFPLGRFRRTKYSYLVRRHLESKVDQFLKKAAGPYNPKTRYGGPENIALSNGYVKEWKNGKRIGFVADKNIEEAWTYFENWYGKEAIDWLEEQHRYTKDKKLELLATVDKARIELEKEGRDVTLSNVKEVITSHSEWRPKLERDIFSDENIEKAIKESLELFG